MIRILIVFEIMNELINEEKINSFILNFKQNNTIKYSIILYSPLLSVYENFGYDVFKSFDNIFEKNNESSFEYIIYIPEKFNVINNFIKDTLNEIIYELLYSPAKYDYYSIPSDNFQFQNIEIYNLKYLKNIVLEKEAKTSLLKIQFRPEQLIKCLLKNKNNYSDIFPLFIKKNFEVPSVKFIDLFYFMLKNIGINSIFDNKDFLLSKKILIICAAKYYYVRHIVDFIKLIYPEISINVLCIEIWNELYKKNKYIDEVFISLKNTLTVENIANIDKQKLSNNYYDIALVLKTSNAIIVNNLINICNYIRVKKIYLLSILDLYFGKHISIKKIINNLFF